jgi:hypothetical protein
MPESESSERRGFLKHLALASGLGLLTATRGWGQDASGPQEERAQLSPEEKEKLKAELQRELERRVYSVDEELFRKVNRAARPGQYDGHERSHVPKIVAPKQPWTTSAGRPRRSELQRSVYCVDG